MNEDKITVLFHTGSVKKLVVKQQFMKVTKSATNFKCLFAPRSLSDQFSISLAIFD